MSLTPEERQRIYEEEKARLDAKKHSISNVIRYWAIMIAVVVVMGLIFEGVSDNDSRKRYNDVNQQFLSSVRHVNLLHIAAIYYGFLRNPWEALASSPQYRLNIGLFYCDEVSRLAEELHRTWTAEMELICKTSQERGPELRPDRGSVVEQIREWSATVGAYGYGFRPLAGLVFTATTVVTDGWLSVALIGIATLLSFVTLLRIQNFKWNWLSVSFAIPAIAAVFLSALLLFAWIVGLVFGGLVQLLSAAMAIPFIGHLLLKVSEHHFSARIVKRLSKESAE